MTILETARLRLEPCAPEHLEGLHAMNRRPEVMRYIGSGEPETLEGTQRMVELVQRCWAHFGFSWWTFIDRASGRVAGAGAVQHLRPEPQRPADWDALRAWPLELLMAETDGPWRNEGPFAGRPTTPALVREVIRAVAELKGLGTEETAAAMLAVTKRFYGI